VLCLVAERMANRAIAERLGISARIVEAHRSRAMLKLNLSSLADRVRYAVRNHLLTHRRIDSQRVNSVSRSMERIRRSTTDSSTT
jgi:Bacterial regulatory proteins, luxR family